MGGNETQLKVLTVAARSLGHDWMRRVEVRPADLRLDTVRTGARKDSGGRPRWCSHSGRPKKWKRNALARDSVMEGRGPRGGCGNCSFPARENGECPRLPLAWKTGGRQKKGGEGEKQ
ncbi:hypothetical protein NDU88_003126 [Pleurodeles waltl]|uniref:Uncharacterized protein n=1 Tax=Pleurodeles waltl TaxID=8319 RepID=A0AAV7MPN8_PLEWA|nr:hypothetical protein NDU88_003126 [Pleurodeles waltl]